jgi:trehalose-6-phosphatase
VSKCVAISLVLNYLKENVAIPDFIFCAGDDESDEQAFRGKSSIALAQIDDKSLNPSS